MSDTDFSVSGWNILPQELIGTISRAKAESDDPAISYGENTDDFYSSGEKPKIIAFSKGEDAEVLAESFADTFREAGMEDGQVIMNWGAPKGTNHMSQWCIENGSPRVGENVEVINESMEDFENYQDRWDDVDVIISLPRTLKSLGKKVEAEYGNLREMFPEAEIAISAGDVMPEGLREEIMDMYGLDDVVNFYANTEFGTVAVEDEEGRYYQANDNLIVEILDEDAEMKPPTDPEKEGENHIFPEEDIYRIDELDEEVTGPILISAPHREELPIIRGRLGDVWTAYPTEDGPRMEFEGREDKVINYSGAMLYPEQVDEAIDQDYKLVASEEDDNVVLNFFLSDYEMNEEEIVEGLRGENKTMDAWYEGGSMKVRSETYESRNELEEILEENYDLSRNQEGEIELLDDDFKASKIAFDASYSSEKRGM